jgi:hypothetical protein
MDSPNLPRDARVNVYFVTRLLLSSVEQKQTVFCGKTRVDPEPPTPHAGVHKVHSSKGAAN